jgi:hypothetical protein
VPAVRLHQQYNNVPARLCMVTRDVLELLNDSPLGIKACGDATTSDLGKRVG